MTEIYPRVYRYGPGWTTALILFFLAFAAGGLACMIWRDQMFGKAPYLGWYFGAFFAGLGLLCLVSLKCRLILYEDRLEYIGIFSRQVVRKAEIKRTCNVQHNTSMLVLTLDLTNGRKMKIGDFNRGDEVFGKWFDAFPNAESEAEDAHAEALLANSAFGGDTETRRAAIARDAGWLAWLGRIGWVAAAWGWFFPRPYLVCMMTLLVLPIVALGLVAASRGRWTLTETKDNRLSLSGLALPPAVAIGIRAMLDEAVVDWKLGLMAGALLALGLLLLVVAVEREVRRGAWLPLIVGCFACGWGGLLYLNMHFDNGAARVYSVSVLTVSAGEHADPVTVTAWGPKPSGNEIEVDDGFYHRIKVGSTICIYVYPGVAHIPWYQYDFCKQA